MVRTAAAFLLLPLLAACHAEAGHGAADGNSADVRLSLGDSAGGNDQMAVALPGFSATMKLPGLALAGQLDVNGIKLAEGSRVNGMDVAGRDHGPGKDDGKVELRFANPRPPAALIAYYRKATEDAGYRIASVSGDGLTATKGGKSFVLAVTADGGGSRGRIDASGN